MSLLSNGPFSLGCTGASGRLGHAPQSVIRTYRPVRCKAYSNDGYDEFWEDDGGKQLLECCKAYLCLTGVPRECVSGPSTSSSGSRKANTNPRTGKSRTSGQGGRRAAASDSYAQQLQQQQQAYNSEDPFTAFRAFQQTAPLQLAASESRERGGHSAAGARRILPKLSQGMGGPPYACKCRPGLRILHFDTYVCTPVSSVLHI